MWMAVIEDGVFCLLENGRSRQQVRDELIRLRSRAGRLVVGIDLRSAFPGGMRKRTAGSAAAIPGVPRTELANHGLLPAPRRFWGRTTRRPQHPGDALRRTERAVSCSPRSIFQIGGAGAVGAGSIRGMSVLHELAGAGFSVWPFEPAGEAAIVEMYPRLFTGKVKSSAPACLQHLNARYPTGELPELFRGMAAATEDAFDAAVSALEMARAGDALRRLPDGDDIDRIEGRIWSPP
jgi:hypothetical protein